MTDSKNTFQAQSPACPTASLLADLSQNYTLLHRTKSFKPLRYLLDRTGDGGVPDVGVDFDQESAAYGSAWHQPVVSGKGSKQGEHFPSRELPRSGVEGIISASDKAKARPAPLVFLAGQDMI